ncbi:hypothetical protein K461DRAFT_306245 [Myriangium duriaei CBS 260.36]|uniref:Uncharacterized protein n=1 Tax=Myriangium duriaei CBS 260.36 TaxID=1168546 RepID=A0A9P4J187_9PEZI|nr:hypothetical protein K461DRAFT_306245 [Myriangium duriaei CBS 260.36]
MSIPAIRLDYRDAWTLRIFIILYGGWCAVYLVDGFINEARRSQHRVLTALKESILFLALGADSLYALLVHTSLRSWIYMLSIGHALYCVIESAISYERMPLKILNRHRVKVLWVIMRGGILVALLRSVLNIINIACQFGKEGLSPQLRKLDVAVMIFNIIGSATFCVAEIYVWFLTKKVARLTTTATTINAMTLLANANLLEGLAGCIEIVDQYLQLQTLEVLILTTGMTALCYYGSLLGTNTMQVTNNTIASGTCQITLLSQEAHNIDVEFQKLWSPPNLRA